MPDNGVGENCDSSDDTTETSVPVAADQTVDTTEDTADGVTITLVGTDADDDDLTLAVVSGPSNGTLGSGSAADCSAVGERTATVVYTPGSNFNGTDVFTFSATDDDGQTSADGTVTVKVASAADATTFAPVAGSKGYFTNKDNRVTVSSVVRSTDPACVANRVVTFTITGGALSEPLVLSDTSGPNGGVGVQATLAPGAYSVALSTPATVTGTSPQTSCAGSGEAGSFTITSAKKPK